MLDFSVVDLQTTIGEHLTQPSWDLATPLDLPSWLLSEAAGAVEKVDTGWFGTGKEEIARSLTRSKIFFAPHGSRPPSVLHFLIKMGTLIIFCSILYLSF